MEPAISRLAIDTSNNLPPANIAAASTANDDSANSQHPSQSRPRDITKDFAKASAALESGQLIKDGSFTLFESVGALEIMDPKMDSGVEAPTEDAIMDGFDPMMYTLPEEIIWLMDQLLCYEVAWHEGSPLSQTLFTSLHLNSLLSYDSRPLDDIVFRTGTKQASKNATSLVLVIMRAYCIGLAKCCDSVIRLIVSEHYYEEEDFVTQTFTRDLLSGVEVSPILTLLDEAKRSIDALDLSDHLKSALRSRLELREALLIAVEIAQPGREGEKRADWEAVSRSLNAIDHSRDLGKPVSRAFSERVQRYLASTTPPRPIVTTSWEHALPTLRQIIEDNVEALGILHVVKRPSPHSIMRFAWDFTSRKPQPLTYSRAFMQSLLLGYGAVVNAVPHIDLLLSDLRELVLAGDPILDPVNWEVEIPTDPRHQLAGKIDEFLNKAMPEYLQLYAMICQNRCRIRRTLGQVIAVLDNLQAMAEDYDTDIHDLCQAAGRKLPRAEPTNFYPLSAWVYAHKLRVMQWVVQLGFELDVYQPDELAAMYCFLAALSTTHSEHLQHIGLVVRSRVQRLTKSKQTLLAAETKASSVFLETQVSLASATALLAQALSSTFTLLTALHLLPTHPPAYSTPALRHELRMKPFLPVGTPAIPSAHDLAAATAPSPSATPAALCAAVDAALKPAKAALQRVKAVAPEDGKFVGCEAGWASDVQRLLRTCIAVGLCVAAVRKACDGSAVEGGVVSVADGQRGEEVGAQGLAALRAKVSVVLPELKDRYHEWWIVPRLVER